MANAKLLPLALLYVDSQRKIEGITRLQKLIFLAQEEYGVEQAFDFKAYDYGPYSNPLYDALDIFEERGLIESSTVKTATGNEKYVYSLTDKGYRLVSQTMANDEEYRPLMQAANEVKKDHNDQSLEQLLQYVYNEYDDYTENSKLDL